MIRQREFVNQHQRRLALFATLGVLALALVLEHSGLGRGEMADADLGQAISMCLAIVEVGAVFVGGLGLFKIRPRLLRASREFVADPLIPVAASDARIPSARAGPSVLQVFRR